MDSTPKKKILYVITKSNWGETSQQKLLLRNHSVSNPAETAVFLHGKTPVFPTPFPRPSPVAAVINIM